jgi:hypothetical protein
MAIAEPLDLVFQLKFEAALQDHVAKKATSKRAKVEAKKRAEDLRERARAIEAARMLASGTT